VIVLMVGIVMAVWVRVAGSVRVLVFVLVEYDLQAPAERISDAAQRLQAWNMIAAFEARDHGFCHPKSLRQLLLSLACMSAKLEQAVSALGGDCDAVIRQALSPSGRAGCALAGSAKVSDARFRRLSIDRFWRQSGRSYANSIPWLRIYQFGIRLGKGRFAVHSGNPTAYCS
jgi:hypothetical protein